MVCNLMKESICVPFVIDGEWLTDFVRTWFWYENKPYEICKELICSCISGGDDDVKTEITNAILEGRKKFVGQNTFELVDDGENVRRITDKLKEKEYKDAIHSIETDIRINGIHYVDPYSTVKSIKKAKEINICTAEECSQWFQYSDDDFQKILFAKYVPLLPAAETATEAGLWLFSRPELIYKCSDCNRIEVGSDKFWNNIYEEIKDEDDFRERNNRYLASKRINADLENTEIDLFSRENNNLSFYEKPHVDNTIPCWAGLVEPNGDFYPADFGHHAGLAFNILNSDPEKYGVEFEETSHGTKHWKGDIDDALDVLVDKGWIVLRYLNGYIITDKVSTNLDSSWSPTKEQKDMVWNAIVKNNVSTSIVSEIYY